MGCVQKSHTKSNPLPQGSYDQSIPFNNNTPFNNGIPFNQGSTYNNFNNTMMYGHSLQSISSP